MMDANSKKLNCLNFFVLNKILITLMKLSFLVLRYRGIKDFRVNHVMSRTALDGFPLKDFEKDFMLDLIKRFSALYFTEILGFCLMGNHFHLLVEMIPLVHSLAYIGLNPARAGLVGRPEECHWNSLGFHIQTENKGQFLSTDFGLKEFSVGSKKEWIRRYAHPRPQF